MPYKVTYEPQNRIAGVKAKTIETETAAEAWRAVDGLMRSDEKVTMIVSPHNGEIGWQEMEQLAAKEAT